MDSLSVADTTVVGGPSSAIGDADFLKKTPQLSNDVPSNRSTSNPGHRMFVSDTDYLDTNRHFFVKIGKDGLIAALNKLDKELQQVGAWIRSNTQPY